MISGWRGQGGARASSVSGLDIIMSEEDVSSEESKKDLVSFLAKVDEIGDLVKGLGSSKDDTASAEAIRKADAYLQSSQHDKKQQSGTDRTVVNKYSSEKEEFCRTLEEDAKERAERRREREAVGKEWRRKGTQAFRRGEFEEAIHHFSKAIQEMPWVIPLYTNRALCFNNLGRYEEAIKDCDSALQFEPGTVRAHVHKGKSLSGMGNHSQAVECFLEALKLNPEKGIRSEIEAAMETTRELAIN